ncbi:FGGY-family carbohydrate kinase [Poseidonocella sedimentorum]|uniref:Sugar (Pentulose or hexulose) kinase n=1 Tax=Poseidonocella sedimentorum TaxID=871652 RepID=A0A1I6EM26_9RHOB|nr:FGGY-family carbohydrate kinase [Poseidonocella sedimentorum]SFR18558.1 Sugar (pentulose or hexulose) kinase [Poseidonocella sedimentorum]
MSAPPPHVAVIDIGKTNAKLALVDTASMTEVEVLTRPNTVRPGPPYPHFDTEALWSFFLDGLAALHARHRIDRISVTTHGACLVLLDARGEIACPVLDYEHDGPVALAAAYDAIRPPFDETGAPRLPGGLNAGAQLHWLTETQPGLRERVAQVVSYPQYWSGRLTGRFTTEPTSLGCHTDLWRPDEMRFSDLPARLGLTMAPLAAASDVAGTLLPALAEATGLPAQTPVHSGIHDSNASLLPHLRQREGAFSVISTGTWVIAMAINGARRALDPARDTLVNVNALGQPTPSARFMGGREFDRLSPQTAAPDDAAVARVLREGLLLLPAVEPGSGPYPQRAGGWSDPEMTPAEKGAALAFYLAMMTAECLSLIGAAGPSIVEGPFARNPLYLAMLRAATGRAVETSATRTGTSLGAALLAAPDAALPAVPSRPSTDTAPDAALMRAYAAHWRAAVAGPQSVDA